MAEKQITVKLMLLLWFGGCVEFSSCDMQLVDMTHPFTNHTIYWPTAKKFQFDVISRGDNGQFWYEANNYAAAEHGGTHIDAPSHFSQGKWRVDQIPINRFITTAAVIDITSKVHTNPDAQLELSDIRNWEKRNGQIPENAALFMNSGWEERWPNETLYLGNDVKNTSDLHFPGIHPDAARWLVANRKLYAIGVDTPSLDHGPSVLFMSHQIFFEQNVYGIENAKNLKLLPAVGATVYIFPMNIQDGSGAPCRIMADIDLASASGCRQQKTKLSALMVALLFLWMKNVLV